MREAWLNSLSLPELQALEYSWEFWGRPEQQVPPGDWFIWLILAGRGFGKTRTGTETVLNWHRQGCRRINLAHRTLNDVVETMLNGVSGIITCAPKDIRPRYKPSRKHLAWPDGRISLCFSAEEGEQARGPASDKLWADELGTWPEERDEQKSLWHNLILGLREGDSAQGLVTTTGRRKKLLRDLIVDPDVHITRGSTYDNAANLSRRFIRRIVERYEGTSLADQELRGDVLEDAKGAFWSQAQIDAHRVSACPPLKRTVMGLDPAVTSSKRSDEIGIVVGGEGEDGDCYILEDLSLRGAPNEWVQLVLKAIRLHRINKLRAETDRGGELIEWALRTAAEQGEPLNCQIETFNSQEDKAGRAEPASLLAQKGRVHHVGRNFELLETELTTWCPASSKSPNRLDAYCFVVLDIFPVVDLGCLENNERVQGFRPAGAMAERVALRQRLSQRFDRFDRPDRRRQRQ